MSTRSTRRRTRPRSSKQAILGAVGLNRNLTIFIHRFLADPGVFFGMTDAEKRRIEKQMDAVLRNVTIR